MSNGRSISSGEITSSQIVKSGAGAISAITIITDGTNKATIILYDNTEASGKKIWEGSVAGTSEYGGRNFVFPVKFDNGLYCAITGTGASSIVEYI